MNVKKNKSVTVKEDVRDQIRARMLAEGRTLQWLSDTTKISYAIIHQTIVRKHIPMTQERLDLINEAINTDFTMTEE